MKEKIETGLIVVRNDMFTKIRRNLFFLFCKKEAKILEMMEVIERPRNIINGPIIIPKEIKIK